jgi:Fic family protein
MNNLASYLAEEKQAKHKGGLYHKIQVNLAYNSNRIEGSKLTEEQIRYIFETRTIGFRDEEAIPVDDIIETSNHFVVFDYLLDPLNNQLSNELIKKFQDGNGRVGRLIIFRECLKNSIIPFIIDERQKQFYYRGLREFDTVRSHLLDTCLSSQDVYIEWIKYFYGENEEKDLF